MGGGVFVGRVVSNRMQKTVVVAVNYVVWVPKYQVYEKRVSRHMAHDNTQQCVVGDIVKITTAGRKLSRHKSYTVSSVLRRMPVYEPKAAAGVAQARDAARHSSATAAAAARLEAAAARLAAAREALGRLSSSEGACTSTSTDADAPARQASISVPPTGRATFSTGVHTEASCHAAGSESHSMPQAAAYSHTLSSSSSSSNQGQFLKTAVSPGLQALVAMHEGAQGVSRTGGLPLPAAAALLGHQRCTGTAGRSLHSLWRPNAWWS